MNLLPELLAQSFLWEEERRVKRAGPRSTRENFMKQPCWVLLNKKGSPHSLSLTVEQ